MNFNEEEEPEGTIAFFANHIAQIMEEEGLSCGELGIQRENGVQWHFSIKIAGIKSDTPTFNKGFSTGNN